MTMKVAQRRMITRHFDFWHVRMIKADGTLANHPGWVVRVETELLTSNPNIPGRKKYIPEAERIEKSWKAAQAEIQKFLDNGPDGEWAGYVLTSDILEFNNKNEGVLHAELY